MQVRGVDPRDTEWEHWEPVYRVYFWDGGCSDEREIRGADVPEVLAWAEREARLSGRSYVLWVRHEREGRPGLLRLAGWEQPSSAALGEVGRPDHAVDRPR